MRLEKDVWSVAKVSINVYWKICFMKRAYRISAGALTDWSKKMLLISMLLLKSSEQIVDISKSDYRCGFHLRMNLRFMLRQTCFDYYLVHSPKHNLTINTSAGESTPKVI